VVTAYCKLVKDLVLALPRSGSGTATAVSEPMFALHDTQIFEPTTPLPNTT